MSLRHWTVNNMKTWSRQLEDALPNASADVYELIMEEFCPYYVLGDDHAPEFLSNEPCDGTLCASCWDSCDSRCRYRDRKKKEKEGDQNET